MSSSLVNYASRVLSVDQESSSFVPIVGLNRAPDMPILDAMMLAWRDCAQLHAAIDEDDIEVPLRLKSPLAPPSRTLQAIATGARMHFMSLSGADPHGLNVDEAASIHVYTQETDFYRVLNQHLRGTDRSKIEPYKPYARASPPLVTRHINHSHRRPSASSSSFSPRFTKSPPPPRFCTVVWPRRWGSCHKSSKRESRLCGGP